MASSSAVVVLFYRYFLPTTKAPSANKLADKTHPPSAPSSSPSATASCTNTALIDDATLKFFQKHSSYYLPLLQKHQTELCHTLGSDTVKGRILLSTEGINGTIACPSEKELNAYKMEMESFDLISDLGVPPTSSSDGSCNTISSDEEVPNAGCGRLFCNIDWKTSSSSSSSGGSNGHHQRLSEPFPDLKIQIVKEIVNTGGRIDVTDIPQSSGEEISPEEFHRILMDARQNDGGVMTDGCKNNVDSTIDSGQKEETTNKSTKKKEVVLIDVRNTFEHSIGHFLHPHSNTITPDGSSDSTDAKATSASCNSNSNNDILQSKTAIDEPENNPSSPTPAINPNTVTFSHFDSNFCSQYSETLKDKKVLMYCTGGIRCVKASAMLKQRGVEDVSHLSGGIHRYVERYGSQGFYKGKVFVFDQRVALDPDAMVPSQHADTAKEEESENMEKNDEAKDERQSTNVVGKCLECKVPCDQISGAILCTVCRDLILLCASCRSSMNEYHCERHQPWKTSYFTFLERFSADELRKQHEELKTMYDTTYVPAKEHKNVRKTLRKQMDKITARIKALEDGTAAVELNATRRCRTCFDSEEVCDGLCWGFWRSLQPSSSTTSTKKEEEEANLLEPILEVKVGDRVTPGPDWNKYRLGSQCCNSTISSGPRKRKRIFDGDNDANDGVQASSPSAATVLEKNEKSVKVGTVVEIKSWASGVTVSWDNCDDPSYASSTHKGGRKKKKNNSCKDNESVAIQQSNIIYRWGAVARNGKRMYDVKKVA